jgi:hypothetical protein
LQPELLEARLFLRRRFALLYLISQGKEVRRKKYGSGGLFAHSGAVWLTYDKILLDKTAKDMLHYILIIK